MTASNERAARTLFSWQQRLLQTLSVQMVRALRREAPALWAAQDAFGPVSVEAITDDTGEAAAYIANLTAQTMQHLLDCGEQFGFEIVQAIADDGEAEAVAVVLRQDNVLLSEGLRA